MWVKVTLAPLTAQGGGTAGVLGLLSDISQYKLTDLALRTSVERLTVAQEVTSDGLWDLDLGTGEVFFSSRFYTMLGYEPYEFPPSTESWEGLMHPDDRAGVQERVREKTRDGAESLEMEFRLRAKDGGWRWILCRGPGAGLGFGWRPPAPGRHQPGRHRAARGGGGLGAHRPPPAQLPGKPAPAGGGLRPRPAW